MQEGCISLMQMAKTSAALAVLAEQRLPYLVFLTDPTYGGVSASFASLGDILIAEPDAMIGFAGRSVIESTIQQKLPEAFQRSDFLIEHGMIDMIVPRGEFRRTVGKLLTCYSAAVSGKPPQPGELPAVPPPPAVADASGRDVWDMVQLARNAERPNALEYISRIFTDFHRLNGDRLFREDAAMVGGLARLGDVQCMVLGTLKGRSISENIDRNFGMPNPEGYRKALRLMQHAAKFRMPIIALVDTPGAYPGFGAEERGQSIAIARNLLEMARFPVPIITVLTGEGGSGGALALAVADRVLILENAYYSVISPEGCSVILFKNVSAAPQAAKASAHYVARSQAPEGGRRHRGGAGRRRSHRHQRHGGQSQECLGNAPARVADERPGAAREGSICPLSKFLISHWPSKSERALAWTQRTTTRSSRW